MKVTEKLSKIGSKILKNKAVLYLITALALLMNVYYLATFNIEAVVYFVILALVIKYFSKNMILILGVPVILVLLMSLSTKNSTNKKSKTQTEGFSDKDKEAPDVKESEKKSEKETDPKNPVGYEEAFEIKKNKNKSGFDVDYASTVEDAYDELNKIIGGDGVKKLTSDTQNLMQQQLQLAEAMKGMQPLIEGIAPLMEQAKGLMGGLGTGGGGMGLDSIAKMAKQFA